MEFKRWSFVKAGANNVERAEDTEGTALRSKTALKITAKLVIFGRP